MTNIPDRVIRVELISYFSLYPGTKATTEEMALRLSRDAKKVERQMEALAELNILEKTCDGNRTVFSYLPPMSVKFAGSRNGGEQRHIDLFKAASPDSNGDNADVKRKTLDVKEGEVDIRLQLMIAALKVETWKECLEALLEVIYRCEGAPCGAYLLGERCSEMLWDCQCGTNGTKAGMIRIDGAQNMVVEGELIKKKGILDTAYYVKYLYPLDNGEDVLICVNRNGSYHLDATFLRSLFIDILPVVAEKRRVELMEEKTAEKVLQDSIYWSTVHSSDMGRGLLGTLACVAKSVEADRVSLLVDDGEGMLRTLSTYGRRENLQDEGQSFSTGEGIAGWCIERGDAANLANPEQDPHFISNDYGDIDSMLCCPLIPPEGEAMGALCAVNKSADNGDCRKHFNDKDMRLFEGITKTLAMALAARDNRTKTLHRKVIQAVLAAQPLQGFSA